MTTHVRITPESTGEFTAATVPTQWVDTRGRRLAFRQFGTGPHLVLALRWLQSIEDRSCPHADG